MEHREDAGRSSGRAPRAGWGAVLWLVGLVTLAKLAYLRWWCPYTLAEDEAWYWLWSRWLEWSYASKGPGIAWLIRGATGVLGDAEWAIRTPAALASGVSAVAVAGLTRDVSRRGLAGLLAAGAFLLMPGFHVMSLLMTIDAPYVMCWALAAWAGWRALKMESRWGWIGLGAALGAGFLFKYTIVLLVPGLALYVFLKRRELDLSPRWGLWALWGAKLALVGIVPVVVWNWEHQWATVRHLIEHVSSARAGDGSWAYRPRWTLEYVGLQFALAGPALVIAGARVVSARRAMVEDYERWGGAAYLAYAALPLLAFYFFISFLSKVQGNWTAAAHVSTACLAGWGAAKAMNGLTRGRAWWRATVVVGVVVILGTLRLDWVASGVDWLRGTRAFGPVVGAWRVPTHRVMGGREMGLDAGRRLGEIRARGGAGEPFVLADHYGRAALLYYYIPGRPEVYCASAFAGGRRTQFDFWERTDLRRAKHLLGRSALVVGAGDAEGVLWKQSFAELEEAGVLAGDGAHRRACFVGLDFLGMPGHRPRDLLPPETLR